MTESVSDEILMAAYQAGNRMAFDALYERHSPGVYGFLVRRLGDRELAADLHQEAFLRLHRARDDYDSSRPFRAWLFAIVHNLVSDTLRARVRSERAGAELRAAASGGGTEVSPELRSPEAIAVARQSGLALKRALDALPGDEATVLLLARVEGLAYEEIGPIIGRSAAAAKQLAYRALKRVRERLIADGLRGDA